MNNKGYIQVYTGNGKGKTTAAIGLAIRAAGRGFKTYMAQFMKKGDYGEILLINKHLGQYITIEQFGLPEFHHQKNGVRPEEREAALRGIAAVKNALSGGKYKIVILDEVNILLYFKIIEVDLVLDIFHNKPAEVELVLTGRGAPDEILSRADLVSEMVEIKHYYSQGLLARLGIEK